MTLSRKRALCWLMAAVMTAALMTCALLFLDVGYTNNDDSGILHVFLGYESEEPADFQLFVHGLIARPLAALSRAFPGLPWFTYAQLALLALSALVLAKGLMQCFVNRGKPLWAGAVLAAAALGALCLKYTVRITFTQTAALLGAAAVAQMLSVDHSRGPARVIMGMCGAAALLVLCYALRAMAVLPALAFCGLAFVLACIEHYLPRKRPVWPMLLSAVLALALLGGMVGLRQWELRSSGAQAYLDLQDANTRLIDYYGLANVPQEAADEVGWSPATFALAKEWCFLHPDITADAFRTLTAYMDAHDTRTLADRIGAGWTLLRSAFASGGMDLRLAAIGLAALALALAGALCAKRPWDAAGLAASVLGGGAMLLYLAMQGRLPMRAMLTVLLPAAVLALGLLPASLPRGAACAGAVLCALYASWCLFALVPALLPDDETDQALGSAMGDLEEYALCEPESLFIYDGTLSGAELRAFPAYPDGIPHNITSWGGWGMRSPQFVELFERFGIDPKQADPSVFLRDDVYLASGRADPPPMLILNWLREEVDPDIDWEIWSEYGNVYIFHFE